MNIIDTLKNESALKFWSHPKRHSQDISGNGEVLTHSGTRFNGNGLQFGSASVADSAGLQGTEWTLVLFGRLRGSTDQGIMSKRDAGGTQYDWFLSGAAELSIYDGTNTRTITPTVEGENYHAISWASGETPVGWTGGASAGNYSGTITVTADDAPLIIGNLYDGSRTNLGTFYHVMAINRKLTADEHALLNTELIALAHRFDSRPWEIPGGTKFVQRKGIIESVATVGVGEIIENSGFRNTGTATTSKVVHTAVKGVLCPVIECVADGVLSIPTSRFHQTPTEAAYGTWEFSLLKTGAGAAPLVAFINGLSNRVIGGGVNNGYILAMSGSETIACSRIDTGSVTNKFTTVTSFFNVGQRYHFKITRSGSGVFTFYMDGVLIDATGGSGTNPFTDATITTSNYIAPDLDAGDQFGGLTKDIV